MLSNIDFSKSKLNNTLLFNAILSKQDIFGNIIARGWGKVDINKNLIFAQEIVDGWQNHYYIKCRKHTLGELRYYSELKEWFSVVPSNLSCRILQTMR